MMKFFFSITVLVIFYTLNSFGVTDVGLIYNDKVPIFQEIVSNFTKQMESSGCKIRIIPLVPDDTGLKDGIIASKCSFFFCIGSQPAKVCLATGFPGVFTMVMDPEKNGLIDINGVPTGKMTGVLLEISPKIKFSYLKQIMGSRKKAAIIYNPSISNLIVADYVKESSAFGFQIVEFPVSNREDVPSTFEQIKGKCNFIISVVDNTVYNLQSIQLILRFSITNKIPLIGFSPQQVKAGALISFNCDYSKLGIQSAKIMETIIGGADVTKMVAEVTNDAKYSFNIQTAKIMKMEIPESIISGAEETYGGE